MGNTKYTESLADFIAQTAWEDLPEEAINKSKWPILDGIAVMFAGLQEETGRGIISFVKDLGGKPTSTILGDGHRTSAPWAAYANGTLAHAIDYDDMNVHMGGHPTAPVLSALLAVGEMARVSGKEILLSYLLGVEVESKLGLAINKVHYSLGWHPTATLGTLGAAVACSKALKLNRDQILMALGIAGSQASALKQNFGTMTKPLHIGQAAKNGVLSSLLASRGWTADREILEGHFGFCNLFVGRGLYDLKNMTENLGKPFDVMHPGIQIKKYPCCGSTHPSLEAMFMILQKHAFDSEEVESVECEVDPERIHVLLHPNPQNGLEAKFSLEYCLAVAILYRVVSIEQFTDERVKESRVKSLLPRIKVCQQTDLKPLSVRLRVKLRDGRVLAFEQNSTSLPGVTSLNELEAKYRDCLAIMLSEQQITKSLEMIQDLERIKDISEIIKILIAQ